MDSETRQFKQAHTHKHTHKHSCPSHYEPAGCDRQARQKRICGEKLWGGEEKGEIEGAERRGLHGEYFNTKTYQLVWTPSLAWTHSFSLTHTHTNALSGPYLLQLT